MKERRSNRGTKIIKLESWDEFISHVRGFRFASIRIFRGQRDPTWKLSSKWERFLNHLKGDIPERNTRELFSDGAYEKVRDSYLDNFKDNAIGLPGFSSIGLSDQDWWALGRHHDLITPLLDWTKSPYVAVFFSYLSLLEHLNPHIYSEINSGSIPIDVGYVSVWELNIMENMLVEDEFELHSTLNDRSHNQKSQQGVFTYLNHEVYIDVESYLQSRKLSDYLIRYDIPSQDMMSAIIDLHKMNINYLTLFPDLYGAAKYSNIFPKLVSFTSFNKSS